MINLAGLPGGWEWIVILIFVALLFLLPILTIVSIIRNKKYTDQEKVLWTILILIANLFGVIIYAAIKGVREIFRFGRY